MSVLAKCRTGVDVRENDAGVTVSGGQFAITVPNWPASFTWSDLIDGVPLSSLRERAGGDFAELRHAAHTLSLLSSFIEYIILMGEQPVARYRSRKTKSDFALLLPRSSLRAYALPPTTFMRFVDRTVQLESALTSASICCYDDELTAWLLKMGTTSDSGASVDPGQSWLTDVMLCLIDGQFVRRMDVAASCESRWEFHDLLFHTRSRFGGQSGGYGPTLRFSQSDEALDHDDEPEVLVAAVPIKLDIPGPVRSTPFYDVMNGRRSIRMPGRPITKGELSEFLYRTSYITVDDGRKYARFPAGGEFHDLCMYLLIEACDGISPGLYRYDREQHSLHLVKTNEGATMVLSEMASRALRQREHPQILFNITSRISRVQIVYESMAYALVLKNLGVLLQTMYLVATEMNLAPCAIGGGSSGQFAAVIEKSPMQEPCIGEFALSATD
ncbi:MULTISPECIES: SagB family peptide dehydrogenase [unclassified Bradyrhizobium]|uniref:SagB family peptide dehydrogenase n=1 Tax=unclassified Bradyrhizobium TaxID=2631580 RepID=UPI001FF6BB70|nr:MULTISPECIES: SagB family peptide dehydrogenase [unclassified Bradyrhizobium]MCJ9700074.1 SagB family peptide dehydrogenase [Bradyrhizobium sp. SHOUNA76]MCJ9729076.1 SagB family peptide dehydrogenase [Bradyrhizobium sp. PRIMUS42]